MRILVLESKLSEAEEQAAAKDNWSPYAYIQPYLLSLGHSCQVVRVRKYHEEEDVLPHLRDVDCVINFCDGGRNDEVAGEEVARLVQDAQVPHTGADYDLYNPTKVEMKMAAMRAGVPTAPFVFGRSMSVVDDAAELLRFPVIVKHYDEDGSTSLLETSKCFTVAQLQTEAKRMLSLAGAVLIEEFITGREFTSLVVENVDAEGHPLPHHVYLPIEVILPGPESFKTCELKYVKFSLMKWVQPDWQGMDKDIADHIVRYSAAIAEEMGVRGYVRLDWRIDSKDRPVFLEINPAPGICSPPNEERSSSDYCLQFNGVSHEEFFAHCIRVAMAKATLAQSLRDCPSD